MAFHYPAKEHTDQPRGESTKVDFAYQNGVSTPVPPSLIVTPNELETERGDDDDDDDDDDDHFRPKCKT